MVKVCPYNYPKSTDDQSCEEHFNQYSYPLYDFQKWAVKGIVDGHHVLVCAPTGSGKTLPGEFAINYFHSKGKKTIYTSPIKALSNEKFHNFTQKYPHISVGLITGDIKTNPDADVLIMTTEIFMNKLYQIKSTTPNLISSVSFEMNIETELGCVVFDEIHMINDESRGHVWEQCIMLLPSHIQMIGLSATLDNPEKFALWLESKGDITKSVEKEVYLTRKLVRTVPLIHYSFITVTNSVNKSIKDKSLQEQIKKLTNKPYVIQDEKGKFNDVNYQNMSNMLKLFEKYNIKMKRQHVLNKVTEFLVQNDMLPALCYVFSRKQLEISAEELTTNLLEFDSKIPYTVDRECEKIIRKLSNYEEYLHLPEYVNTVKLLRKGVGIHHAGLMPVLREMTELLFARGFIKVLFCTETMGVGINLPVKTTIFTGISKFNGEIMRNLYSHEYTQSAGRAGRLGLDKVGHVIHLNNLFPTLSAQLVTTLMNGKPQALTSKFKISYNLLLNLLDIGDHNLIQFASRSMITTDLDDQLKEIDYKLSTLQTESDNINNSVVQLRTPAEVLEEYLEINTSIHSLVNKKRKEAERKIQNIVDNHKFLTQDLQNYQKNNIKEKELTQLKNQYDSLRNYFQYGVGNVLQLLMDEKFIETDGIINECNIQESNFKLSIKGKIASQIREIHCLTFSQLFEENKLDELSSHQLVALFSCFTNIRVADDYKDYLPMSNDKFINNVVLIVHQQYNSYIDKELARNINTGFDYVIHFDLLNYIEQWCQCENIEECKFVLQEIGEKKKIYLGEFVKALLKINNISSEFEKIAEFTGNTQFLSKLKEIPHLTLKYVVTNQSLYV